MSNHPEPSSSLLEGVRRGSVDSWTRLLEMYAPVVLRWCRRKGLRPPDTDDVLQDVFRTVAERVAGFRRDREGSFVGWLFCVTRSRIADHYRRDAGEPAPVGGSDFRQRLSEVPQPGEEADEGAFEQVALRRALDLAEQSFASRTWRAFWRTVIDGQDTALVAAELGMRPGAVRVARCRVLQRIRDLME